MTEADTEAGPGAPSGHLFTATEAAEATGTSKRTILRRIDALIEHGAHRGEDGTWRIPIGALFAVGFRINAPRHEADETVEIPAPEPATPAAPRATGDAEALAAALAEVEQWRNRAVEAEQRAAVAEAVATERAQLAHAWHQYAEGMSVALRQLTPAEQPRKRRWFGR
jgi:hypothetical protein